jgi:hypothetical protein
MPAAGKRPRPHHARHLDFETKRRSFGAPRSVFWECVTAVHNGLFWSAGAVYGSASDRGLGGGLPYGRGACGIHELKDVAWIVAGVRRRQALPSMSPPRWGVLFAVRQVIWPTAMAMAVIVAASPLSSTRSLVLTS